MIYTTLNKFVVYNNLITRIYLDIIKSLIPSNLILLEPCLKNFLIVNSCTL